MKKFKLLFVLLLTMACVLSACSTADRPSSDFSSGVESIPAATTATPSSTAEQATLPSVPEVTVPVAPETESTTAGSQGTGEAPESTTGDTTAVQPPSGEDPGKVIAFSFDDGPDMRYTSSTKRILDTLEKYDAKATFFVLATQLDYNGYADDAKTETFAQRNAKLVKRAYDMGMEIGSHTYNHKDLNKLSSEEIKEELSSACEKTNAITGGEVKIMRPPYGNANATVREAINMPMIIWDVDSLDWESKDPDKIYNEVMSHVRPGSVVLFHDIYNTTADGIEKLVPDLIDQGYRIVTVSELYRLYGKTLEPHKVYMSAWYDD